MRTLWTLSSLVLLISCDESKPIPATTDTDTTTNTETATETDTDTETIEDMDGDGVADAETVEETVGGQMRQTTAILLLCTHEICEDLQPQTSERQRKAEVHRALRWFGS